MSTEGRLTQANLNVIEKKQQEVLDEGEKSDTASVSSDTSSKGSEKQSIIGSLFGSSKKTSSPSLPSMMDVDEQKKNATSLAELLNIIVKENKKEEEQKEKVTTEINEAKTEAINQLQNISELIKKLKQTKNVEPKDINKIAGQNEWYKMRDNIKKDVKFSQGEGEGEGEINSLRKNLSRYLAIKFDLPSSAEDSPEPETYNKLIDNWKTLKEQAEYQEIKNAYEVLNNEESIKRIIKTNEKVYGEPNIVSYGIWAGIDTKGNEIYLVNGGIFKSGDREFIPYIDKTNKIVIQYDKILFYDKEEKLHRLYWEKAGKNWKDFTNDRGHDFQIGMNVVQSKIDQARQGIDSVVETTRQGIDSGVESGRKFFYDDRGSDKVKEHKLNFKKALLKRAKTEVKFKHDTEDNLEKWEDGTEAAQIDRIHKALKHLTFNKLPPFDQGNDPLTYLESKIGIIDGYQDLKDNHDDAMDSAVNEEDFGTLIIQEANRQLDWWKGEGVNYGIGTLGGKNKKKTIKKRPKRKGTRRR